MKTIKTTAAAAKRNCLKTYPLDACIFCFSLDTYLSLRFQRFVNIRGTFILEFCCFSGGSIGCFIFIIFFRFFLVAEDGNILNYLLIFIWHLQDFWCLLFLSDFF